MVKFNSKGVQVYANKNMLMQHLLYKLQHITLKARYNIIALFGVTMKYIL